MPKALPPLRALVAFEASVRHGSFKQAALELHLTPGAVSQQVRKLEAWLGYLLFKRQVRKLVVTELGMNYYGQIAPALEQIHAASEVNPLRNDNRVCLSLTQALASKWLGPRLDRFVSQYPHFELHINASNNPVDFDMDSVDLAIRHFDGNDPQLNKHLVFDDEIRLFCSPEYLNTKTLDGPEQLTKATLIATTIQPFWERWLAEFTSIPTQEVQRITTLYFDQTLLAIEAAKRNQGVVLSNRLLVHEELKRGELIEPFGHKLSLEKSYYVVYPKDKPLTTAASTFKDWLLKQFKEQ